MIRPFPTLLLLSLALPLCAEVKLSALFSDHVVLQRGARTPVWGTADPHEKVTVTFREQRATATADQHGEWKAELTNLAVGEAAALTVSGTNTVTINDVLVGDVWLCSGQSNMAFALNAAEDAEREMAAANFPLIRHMRLPLRTADTPQRTVGGKWEVCTPETAKNFTAVGYFFAKEIQTDIGVPIGLINSTWGGTGATSWMSPQALTCDPAVTERWAQTLADFPEANRKYAEALGAWQVEDAAAKSAGAPFDKKKPNPPSGPGDRNTPGGLWNGMIAPLVPCAMKGILWYQGEQDASKFAGYRSWFPALIAQWRRDFGQGNLPFLFVQLPNHNSEGANSLSWAGMRGVQAEALVLPKTGMAVTIDVGENENVHPKKKQPVGHRLALIAKAKVYGIQVAFEGPVFGAAVAGGGAMIVRFQRGAQGLAGKSGALREFQLAGEDRKWKCADAVIEGETLRVTSAEVPAPVAVRYAWRNGSEANLYNSDDLPAAPFRSDDWK